MTRHLSPLQRLFSIKAPKKKEYVTIKEICTIFQVSSWSIYEGVRTDPSFPVVNLGKKNYRIDPREYKLWLDRKRNQHRKDRLLIPTADDLLQGTG